MKTVSPTDSQVHCYCNVKSHFQRCFTYHSRPHAQPGASLWRLRAGAVISLCPSKRDSKGLIVSTKATPEFKEGLGEAESEQTLPAWSGDYSPGDLLGKKYRVKEILGRGSNAVTYKATAGNGKEVAVKALSLRRMTGWKQLELFEREAKTLESLTHPCIPQYIDFFEEDSEKDRGFFLVQELAQGKSLAQLVEGGWRADEAEARRIAAEILGVLDYLGSRRPPVVHRDVKPENIVLEGGKTGGRVFLVDFGGVQAAAASDTLGMASTVIGTYGYMSPEQFRGAAQPASDLYALGGTLLYLLSGRPPNAFPQERMQISFKDMIDVSPELCTVLEGLLEPVIEDRISASDALGVLSGQVSASDLLRGADDPPGGRAKIRQKRDRLRIDIPPASMVSPEKLGLAGFAVTWNLGIGFWTASALAAGSLAAAAFSIPFWAAGFSVARDAFRSSLAEERIELNSRGWSISRARRFSKKGGEKPSVEGRTRALKGAQVIVTGYVNGVPRTEIKLVEGFREHRFGSGLSTVEQQWIATKITSFLKGLPGQPAPELPPLPSPANSDYRRYLDPGSSRWDGEWSSRMGGLHRGLPGGSVWDEYEANIIWEDEQRQDGANSLPASRNRSPGLGSYEADSSRSDKHSSSPATHESELSANDLTTDDLGLSSSPDDSFTAG